MKAKERHQLKKNELQETLEDIWIFLQKNGSRVLSIVILIIVIIGMILYLSYSGKQVRAQQWDQLFALSTNAASVRPEDLQRLAEESSDKNFAAFALVRAGDMWLMQALFDKDADKNKLYSNAQKVYSKVISQYSENKIALGSANIGMSVIYENVEKWDDAKKAYQTIISNKDFIGTGIAMLAKNRLANIDNWKQDWHVKLASDKQAQSQPTTAKAKPTSK